MKKALRSISLGLILVFVLSVVAFSYEAEDKILKDVWASRENLTPLPIFSKTYGPLSLEEAYNIQEKFVKEAISKGEEVIGYKVAFSSQPAMKKFGAKEPAYGVLFKSMLLKNGAEVDHSKYYRLFIENEVAIIIGKDVKGPLSSVDELKKYVKGAAPAIEFPDLRFKELKGITVPDVVADNAGAAIFLVGEMIPIENINVDSLEVVFSKDGEVINKAPSTQAYGGPLKSVLWLINSLAERGKGLKAGYIVMTGALGKMVPAKPGHYVEDFGKLGKNEFVVK